MNRDVCGICWCPYGDDGECGCKPASQPGHIPDAGKMMPESLRLADALLEANWSKHDWEAAAELRRLQHELDATDRQVEILTDALHRCNEQNKTLRSIAEELIRVYLVPDEAYDPEGDGKRIMARLWKEHSK